VSRRLLKGFFCSGKTFLMNVFKGLGPADFLEIQGLYHMFLIVSFETLLFLTSFGGDSHKLF
jgi:hypothetical protein